MYVLALFSLEVSFFLFHFIFYFHNFASYQSKKHDKTLFFK